MAKNIFVVSDTWFNRPVGDKSNMKASEYNDNLIGLWNKIVKKNDIVYVLGGFGISELYTIVAQLNGNIHFLNNYYTDDEKDFMNTLKYCLENTIDNKLKKRIVFENEQILALKDEDVILSYFPLNNWYGKCTDENNIGTLCFHGLTTTNNLKDGNISCSAKLININDVRDKLDTFKEVLSSY